MAKFKKNYYIKNPETQRKIDILSDLSGVKVEDLIQKIVEDYVKKNSDKITQVEKRGDIIYSHVSDDKYRVNIMAEDSCYEYLTDGSKLVKSLFNKTFNDFDTVVEKVDPKTFFDLENSLLSEKIIQILKNYEEEKKSNDNGPIDEEKENNNPSKKMTEILKSYEEEENPKMKNKI